MYDTRQIGFDCFGGNADNAIAPRFQPLLSLQVVFALPRMDSAVHFNDQMVERCIEVNNKWANYGLATELHAAHLAIPQRVPQQRL